VARARGGAGCSHEQAARQRGPNKQIADELGTSQVTVKEQRAHVDADDAAAVRNSPHRECLTPTKVG